MSRLPFQDADPSRRDFQYLEDLATSYWYADLLFAALEVELFEHIGPEGASLAMIARKGNLVEPVLARCLAVLEGIALVGRHQDRYYCQAVTRRYLLRDNPDYLGDFLLYRRYLQPNWSTLARRLRPGDRPGAAPAIEIHQDRDYAERNYRYVRAMDALARLKTVEISRLLCVLDWDFPLLDAGGGAGAVCRQLLRDRPGGRADLFDLEEVIDAAHRLYPGPEQWVGIRPRAGDFRSHAFSSEDRYGMVFLGNFLHAYGPGEARRLLDKAVSLLECDGLLVIHDYFTGGYRLLGTHEMPL